MAILIPIDDELHLSEIRREDAPLYVEYFKDPDIYANTLRIPSPYTLKDAEEFFQRVNEVTEKFGHPVNFAIRSVKGELLGGMGFIHFDPTIHKVEIGYWLGRPHRGKGIMTRAVKAFCDHAHKRFGFLRFTAGIFVGNKNSVKVVERAGFQFEGVHRKVYLKDGRYIDCQMYAKIY